MKKSTRKIVKGAIRDLKFALNPKADGISQEDEDKRIVHILHTVKGNIDTATSEIKGSTSTHWTQTHRDTEELSDKLLSEYFTNGDIESIRALAMGLIAQLTPTQARQHLEAFEEHYEQYMEQ